MRLLDMPGMANQNKLKLLSHPFDRITCYSTVVTKVSAVRSCFLLACMSNSAASLFPRRTRDFAGKHLNLNRSPSHFSSSFGLRWLST